MTRYNNILLKLLYKFYLFFKNSFDGHRSWVRLYCLCVFCYHRPCCHRCTHSLMGHEVRIGCGLARNR